MLADTPRPGRWTTLGGLVLGEHGCAHEGRQHYDESHWTAPLGEAGSFESISLARGHPAAIGSDYAVGGGSCKLTRTAALERDRASMACDDSANDFEICHPRVTGVCR